jgi:ADP-heptose:LPS heptosyltransferase
VVKRIAVVRALQLGDMLVSVPALRALRELYPQAEITLIGLPWAAWFSERFSSYIDRFVEFPGWPGIEEASYCPERTHIFLGEQRAYRYDLAIQMHGNGQKMNEFVLGLGADVTAGYFIEEHPQKFSPASLYPDDLPEVLRNLGLVELLGASDPSPHLEFPLTDGDYAEAAGLLPSRGIAGGSRVGIHAGASAASRRWPADRFAAVANELASLHGDQIILTGGPGEEGIAADLAKLIEAPVINLAGRTTLGGLAAVIAGLDLFISNDTGPGHIATALGVPSVTIFGPADVRRWAPLDTVRHTIVHHPVECSPCPYRICPIDHRCLMGIEPSDVLSASESVLLRAKVV